MKVIFSIVFIQIFDITYSIPVRPKNPSKALRHPDLFDGDIVINNKQFFNAIPNDNQRWPSGIIPYEIDIGLRDREEMLKSAFEHFNQKTCLLFRKRRDERDYIYIHSGDSDNCQSMVGLAGGRQELDLGYSCFYMGTILHELMHVAGFYHEHSRSDRDSYITIHRENILEGKEKNFEILKPNENRLMERSFDYQSIMIYGETSFSKNTLPTMTANNKERLTDPYYKHSLSQLDIKSINKLYGCHKT